jgi:response regulator RpfG family c-di-GMP phosphodiesterase
MTLLRSTSDMGDAIRLLSAIGDALGGHETGFAMRVARVAARFALHRGANPEMVAASYFAAALHGIGAVRVVVPAGVSEREAAIAAWDAPVAGALISATIAGLPRATGDYIRWHREAFDGTGFPDKLRWNGIPHAAMAINVARAFVAAIEEQGEDASPPEALFTIVGDCGRAFAVNVIREFREFYASAPTTFDDPIEPEWPLDAGDGDAVVAAMCTEIDARDESTIGRGARLDKLTRSIAEASPELGIDTNRAAFAARLMSLGRLHGKHHADDFDPLARLGREARAAVAAAAAHILSSSPAYTSYASIIAQTEEWFDGTGLPERLKGDAIDPTARVLSVALAAGALDGSIYADAGSGYPEATARIAAAAGTQFDPAAVAAYLKAAT